MTFVDDLPIELRTAFNIEWPSLFPRNPGATFSHDRISRSPPRLISWIRSGRLTVSISPTLATSWFTASSVRKRSMMPASGTMYSSAPPTVTSLPSPSSPSSQTRPLTFTVQNIG